jgi:flagellar motor switch protein FliM
MTEEIDTLTKEELEALQSTRDDNHLTELVNGESAEVIKHDLASQHSNARIDAQIFDTICRKVAARLQQSISSVLNIPLRIDYASTEVTAFEVLTSELSSPISSTTLHLNPLEGEALVLINSKIIFDSLDRFFGGAGVSTIGFTPDRTFAGSEEAIVDILITLVSGALKEGWEPVTSSNFEKGRSAEHPENLQCFRDEELVVVSRFRASLGDAVGDTLIIYPLTSVRGPTQAHSRKLGGEERESDDAGWGANLHQACLELEVEMCALFGEFTTTLGELSTIKVGDEFSLSKNYPLDITVEGVRLFTGTPGKIGNISAIRIDSVKKI